MKRKDISIPQEEAKNKDPSVPFHLYRMAPRLSLASTLSSDDLEIPLTSRHQRTEEKKMNDCNFSVVFPGKNCRHETPKLRNRH
jgi:hypothetical protein